MFLKEEFLQEAKNNPYITYNCLIQSKDYLLVSNGSHTDFIAQKLDLGYSSRDALSSILLSMDFEYDQLDTPRIAGIVNKKERNSKFRHSSGVMALKLKQCHVKQEKYIIFLLMNIII